MSGVLMRRVFELDGLTRAQQIVLLAYCSWADDDGSSVYPAAARVAWQTGYSERYVRRVRDELREMGPLVSVAPAIGQKAEEFAVDLGALRRKPKYVSQRRLRADRGVRTNSEVCGPAGPKCA